MCTSLDVVVGIFALFFISPSAALPISDDDVSKEKHQLNQTFNKLLYELVDLNLERLKAINRVLKLQVYPRGLRSSGEERGEDHNVLLDNHPLILFLVNRKNSNNENDDSSEKSSRPLIAYLRPNYAINRSKSSKEGLSIALPNEAEGNLNKTAERKAILRGWNSCKKSATKTCTKACKSASKEVCKDYKCSRRMKKAFKKRCKSSCNDKFD